MKRIFLALIVLAMVSGCSVIETPDIIIPDEISYDGGEKNSGVLYASEDGKGFIVTKNLIDRYNGLMTIKYSKKINNEVVTTELKDLFTPPLQENDGVINIDGESYFIDNQFYSKFLLMNILNKTGGVVDE